MRSQHALRAPHCHVARRIPAVRLRYVPQSNLPHGEQPSNKRCGHTRRSRSAGRSKTEQPMNLSRLWSEADDALLRDLAKTISPQRICVRMNRTMSAINNRCLQLGVRLEHRLVLRKRNSPSTVLTQITKHSIPTITCPACSKNMRLSMMEALDNRERIVYACDCGFEYYQSSLAAEKRKYSRG